MAAEPATALIAKLDQAGIAYELISHQRTLTAAAEAEAVGVQPWKVAKTRVLTTPKGFVRAVLPCGVPKVWGAKNRVPPANPHFSGTRTEF